MSKIQIPIANVQTGGSLFNWYYNNCIIRSDVSKSTDDNFAYAEDNFNLSIAEVTSILTTGGEVEQYLMAIEADIAILSTNVPSGLPNRLKWDGTVKKFNDWFIPGAEVWKKDDNTKILFYTNPFASNQDKYLKGSEIKAIYEISPALIDVLTITQAQVEVSTGWTKL